MPAQPHESSSVTRAVSSTPPPIPPYSSGIGTAKMSASAKIFTMSQGNSAVSS